MPLQKFQPKDPQAYVIKYDKKEKKTIIKNEEEKWEDGFGRRRQEQLNKKIKR